MSVTVPLADEAFGLDAVRDDETFPSIHTVPYCLGFGVSADAEVSVEQAEKAMDPKALVEGKGIGDIEAVKYGHDLFSWEEYPDDCSDGSQNTVTEDKDVRAEHEETCLEECEG